MYGWLLGGKYEKLWLKFYIVGFVRVVRLCGWISVKGFEIAGWMVVV